MWSCVGKRRWPHPWLLMFLLLESRDGRANALVNTVAVPLSGPGVGWTIFSSAVDARALHPNFTIGQFAGRRWRGPGRCSPRSSSGRERKTAETMWNRISCPRSFPSWSGYSGSTRRMCLFRRCQEAMVCRTETLERWRIFRPALSRFSRWGTPDLHSCRPNPRPKSG